MRNKDSSLVCSFITLILIIAIAFQFIILSERVNSPVVKPAFDHSQCQYPGRTTNPPNGCDNSVPCNPINTKGGDGSCGLVIVDEFK